MLVKDVELGTPVGADITEIGPLSMRRLCHSDALRLIRSAVLMRNPLDIAICNAHTVLLALDDPDYAAVLQKMTLLNDGIGIQCASILLNGRPFADNLNGTDFVPALLDQVGVSLRIYLLGAGEEQVQKTRAHIEKKFPMHTVVGSRNGFFDQSEIPQICADVSDARPDLLLVAMGNPLQEKFIVEHRERLNACVAIGVGALFDFMSGSVARAPKAFRVLKLEWLYRMLQEPRRLFGRYMIGGPRFLYQILCLRFSR